MLKDVKQFLKDVHEICLDIKDHDKGVQKRLDELIKELKILNSFARKADKESR